jgi:hypothetical protein
MMGWLAVKETKIYSESNGRWVGGQRNPKIVFFFTGEGMTVEEFSHISKPTVEGLPYSL